MTHCFLSSCARFRAPASYNRCPFYAVNWRWQIGLPVKLEVAVWQLVANLNSQQHLVCICFEHTRHITTSFEGVVLLSFSSIRALLLPFIPAVWNPWVNAIDNIFYCFLWQAILIFSTFTPFVLSLSRRIFFNAPWFHLNAHSSEPLEPALFTLSFSILATKHFCIVIIIVHIVFSIALSPLASSFTTPSFSCATTAYS